MAIYVKVGDHGKYKKMSPESARRVQYSHRKEDVEIKLTGSSTNMIKEKKDVEKKKMGFGSGFRF